MGTQVAQSTLSITLPGYTMLIMSCSSSLVGISCKLPATSRDGRHDTVLHESSSMGTTVTSPPPPLLPTSTWARLRASGTCQLTCMSATTNSVGGGGGVVARGMNASSGLAEREGGWWGAGVCSSAAVSVSPGSSRLNSLSLATFCLTIDRRPSQATTHRQLRGMGGGVGGAVGDPRAAAAVAAGVVGDAVTGTRVRLMSSCVGVAPRLRWSMVRPRWMRSAWPSCASRSVRIVSTDERFTTTGSVRFASELKCASAVTLPSIISRSLVRASPAFNTSSDTPRFCSMSIVCLCSTAALPPSSSTGRSPSSSTSELLSARLSMPRVASSVALVSTSSQSTCRRARSRARVRPLTPLLMITTDACREAGGDGSADAIALS
mmetsp:Transcript_23143/g.66312  ORF Transcript_23143/g.66312 Transcript_23143/m.66312 type:complete len:378 (-) Transcript_23143:39-1172(-)